MITTVTHHGSRSNHDSSTSAEPVSALSAMGSAILPNEVTWPVRRAQLAVDEVGDGRDQEDQRRPGLPAGVVAVETRPSHHHEDRNEQQPAHGEGVGDVPRRKPRRRSASVIGRDQPSTSRPPGRPRWTPTTRASTQAPTAASTPGSSTTPSTSGPWCAARPIGRRHRRAPRPGRAPSHRSARLRDRQRAPRRAGRRDADARRSRGRRAARRGRPPRCRPRRSSRTHRRRRAEPRSRKSLSICDVVFGLAGEPDDDVGPDARVGASARTEPIRSRNALGVAEPTHPPQQRAAGVLEGQVEVRRDTAGVPAIASTRPGRISAGCR